MSTLRSVREETARAEGEMSRYRNVCCWLFKVKGLTTKYVPFFSFSSKSRFDRWKMKKGKQDRPCMCVVSVQSKLRIGLIISPSSPESWRIFFNGDLAQQPLGGVYTY